MTGGGDRAVEVRCASVADTARLGAALAGLLEPGDVVLLSGELGAGKTTLVKALVAALGSTEEVTSPTFTLLRTYATCPPVAHVDCWRLEQLHEVLDLGLEELLDDGGVALVEWGEAAAARFGQGALRVELALPEPALPEPAPAGTGDGSGSTAEGDPPGEGREIELVGEGSWPARLERLVVALGGA